MAALPVGGGSAPAGREELQVPESRAPVAVFLAQVAVSPVAAARRYTSRRQHSGLWRLGVEVERDHLPRSTEDVFTEPARAGESATAGVWQRLKGRPRGGEGLGCALSVEYESWRPAN